MLNNRFLLNGALTMLLLMNIGIVAYAQQPMRLRAYSKYEWGGVFGPPDFGRRDTLTYEYQPDRKYNTARKKWYWDKAIYEGQNFNNNEYVVARDSNTFDSNGNIIYSFQRTYPNDTASIISYTYTANNKPETELCWHRTADSYYNRLWDTLYYYRYAYNSNNTVANEIIANYSFYYKEWTIDSNIYSYNGTVKTGKFTYRWDSKKTPAGWKEHDRYTYKYKNGLIDSVVREGISNNTGLFEPEDLTVYHYNAANDSDMVTNYARDWFTGVWMDDERHIYNVDANHNYLSHVLQRGRNSNWSNKFKDSTVYNGANLPIIEIKDMVWDNDSGKFVNVQSFYKPTYKNLYFYEFATGIEDTKLLNRGLTIYPNPAKDKLVIKLDGYKSKQIAITIYDATGRVIKHLPSYELNRSQCTIDVSNLPIGNYLIQVSGDQRVYQKFIIASSQ